MKSYLSNIPENIKETLRAATPFLVVLILFVSVGKFGMSKITTLRSQITEAKQIENILTEKLSILQSFSSSPENSISLITSVLPVGNSSVATTSQLKNLAAQNGIIITSLKSGSASKVASGLSYADITFEVTGSKLSITNLLNSVAKIAPISQVQKIRMSENGGLASANIVVRTYWADYPKTIPSVTQPITNLSNSEKLLVSQMSELTLPMFSVTTSAEGEMNTAPFGE
jgi:hypothetical protein